MTEGKQELSPRSKATKTSKETAVVSIKASDKQALSIKRSVRPKNSAARFGQRSDIDKDERRAMIAEAAYYRYQNRGYEEGCDVDDWLAAEEEIDRLLDF